MSGTKTWAIILVIIMTGLTSSAQVMYKLAALPGASLMQVFLSPFLWIGIALYGLGFILLNIAFRGGEVSTLYPIIATSYIWVAILSYFLFDEHLSLLKLIGIISIVIGVALISRSDKSGAVAEEVPV
ncbi:MAG: EamA family transporter [Nanoarchaeota archaeon]